MKCLNLLILVTILFFTHYAYAQAPLAPCPCDTLELSNGTTGNDIIEALCPGGQLSEDAELFTTSEVIEVFSATFVYLVNSAPTLCSINESGVTGLGLELSEQQVEFCKRSLIERCSLLRKPIPALSEWSIIATAVLLGIVGLFVAARRRKAAA